MQRPRGPHRGQSPLPQGIDGAAQLLLPLQSPPPQGPTVLRGAHRRSRSPVGAGSTRDGGGAVGAGSKMCSVREAPIAGRARSHRGLMVLPKSHYHCRAWSYRELMLLPRSYCRCGVRSHGAERSYAALICAVDPLWERVLPAMAAGGSPRKPALATRNLGYP